MGSPTPLEAAFREVIKTAVALRPGDIVLMTPKPIDKGLGLASSATLQAFHTVVKDLQGDKVHAAIYTGNGEVVEARLSSGVSRLALTKALKDVSAVVVRPDVSAKERRAAARKALQMHAAGLRYDLLGLGRALVQELGIPTREKTKLDAVTCSTLISNAYETRLVNKPKDAVMPADFLRSAKMRVIAHLGGSHASDR